MEVSIVNPVQICVPWKRSKLHDVSETYGLIPQLDLQTINHFDAVHVNTIWLFYNDRSYAKPVVDKATRWLEISIYPDNKWLPTADNLELTWLCRCKRPKCRVRIRKLIQHSIIQFKCLTATPSRQNQFFAKNSRSNAVCQRFHSAYNNCIRCHYGTDCRKET